MLLQPLIGLSRKFGEVIYDGLEPERQGLLAIAFMKATT
jgi:hypothetical protein